MKSEIIYKVEGAHFTSKLYTSRDYFTGERCTERFVTAYCAGGIKVNLYQKTYLERKTNARVWASVSVDRGSYKDLTVYQGFETTGSRWTASESWKAFGHALEFFEF